MKRKVSLHSSKHTVPINLYIYVLVCEIDILDFYMLKLTGTLFTQAVKLIPFFLQCMLIKLQLD